MNKEEQTDAQITTYDDHKSYVITLKTKHNVYSTNQRVNVFLSQLLLYLAHEMSHLRFWTHCPEHMMLESKIYYRFAKTAKKLGVKDTWMRI